MFTRATIGPQYEQDEASVLLTFKVHFNTYTKNGQVVSFFQVFW